MKAGAEVLPNAAAKAREGGMLNHWLPLLVGVWVWALIWYWPTAQQMAGVWWRSDTYAHGLLVMPIFAWMVWRKRAALDTAPLRPSVWALFPLAASGALWLMAQWVSLDGLAHFALISLLVSAMVCVLGGALARQLLFPLGFLYFGLPIGEFLLPTLMHYTAEFTVAALRVSGVPVYQEGLFFVVPNGTWSVVEACSGLRYLVASLFVGTLYAYLNYRSPWRRAAFMGFSLLMPIVANWVRAYLIVLVGYLSDNKIAAGVDHLIYGWLFFGFVIFLMFWIGSFWREPVVSAPPAEAALRADAASRDHSVRHTWVLVALAFVMALFPLWALLGQREVAPFTVALDAPVPAAGWSLESGELLGYRPNFSGHRGELFQLYRRSTDGVRVGLYVAYYAEQEDDSEMVAWHNRLLGREDATPGWILLTNERASLAGQPVQAVSLGRPQAAQRVLLWHWYWSNQRHLVSDLEAKAFLALDRLTGRADDAAFVALYVAEQDLAAIVRGGQTEQAAAREVVEAFWRDHGSALETMLTARELRK